MRQKVRIQFQGPFAFKRDEAVRSKLYLHQEISFSGLHRQILLK